MNPPAPEPWLAALLARYPAACRPRGPVAPLGNAGGLSGTRFWRFEAACGALAVRLWPPEASEEHLTRVHAWLARAVDACPVLAGPLADAAGRTLHAVAGRWAQVEPWRPGAAVAGPPPAGCLEAAVGAVAALHRAWRAEGRFAPSPGLRTRLRLLRALVEGEFGLLAGVLDRSPPGSERTWGLAWLAAARRAAGPAVADLERHHALPTWIQPVLRDCRPEHFLFEGRRLSGLVDFGAMGVDSPAADLARLLGDWLGSDPEARAAALAAYRHHHELDPAGAALVPVFERAGAILAGAHWIRWHFLEGRRFDAPEAAAEGLRRAAERLAHAQKTDASQGFCR